MFATANYAPFYIAYSNQAKGRGQVKKQILNRKRMLKFMFMIR